MSGLATLLFIGLCAAFLLLASQVVFRVWGPLDESLQIINNDFQVKQVFGQPITPGLLVTGKTSEHQAVSSAQLRVPIFGPRRSGHLRVSGRRQLGFWELSIWVTYDEGGKEQTIYIARKVK